jgi:hypothetical protein
VSRLAVRIGLVVAVLAVLTGCSTSDRPPGPDSQPRFPGDVPQELRVADPKDARGIPACDLLTRDQLVELGLDPSTASPDRRLLGESCVWYYADGSTFASVSISTDPTATKLPGMYRLHHAEPGFEILQITGHPALRFDLDPAVQCGLAVGVADFQNLGTDGYYDREPRPDICAQSRRMAEMILANLPPLVEEAR